MLAITTLSLLLLHATAAAALDILVPLYIYPSTVWNDNASEWQSLLSTVRAHRAVNFDVIVNADSGPGADLADVNYAAGIGLLNAEPNVRTLAYVHCDYGRIATDAVVANATLWRSIGGGAGLDGLFFDETPNVHPWSSVCSEQAGCTTAEYMAHLARRTRAAGYGYLVYNVGQQVAQANEAAYLRDADQIIAFEQSWDVYKATQPLVAGLPGSGAGAAGKSNIMVHHFDGTLGELEAEVRRIAAEPRVGSVWFTTIEYQTYDTPPANAENLARIIETL
ncbi:uncharacterized protein PgNI_07800 [Pyricularia grisea]|uniref:Spherulation-specific family 4 n=1 Tax=Pyricularia grisea TaxID=148305 RepID=A0A6P8B2E9_PYRGI|nr:uncharacterized protein PgNI_07800 [Pyricularia grisea]TLD09042.1 hypothetical protein PgNI_07800 [Pyricularia grisea]